MKNFREIWKKWVNIKIGVAGKINRTYIILVVFLFIVISIFIYNLFLHITLKNINVNLNTANGYVHKSIDNLYDGLNRDLTLISEQYKPENDSKTEFYTLLDIIKKDKKYLAIHTINNDGHIIYSTNKKMLNNKEFSFKSNYGIKSRKDKKIKIYGTFRREKMAIAMATKPLLDEKKIITGTLIIEFSYQHLESTIKYNNADKKNENRQVKYTSLLMQNFSITNEYLNSEIDIVGNNGYVCIYPNNDILSRFQVVPIDFNKIILDNAEKQNNNLNQTIKLGIEGLYDEEFIAALEYVSEFNVYILSLINKKVVYQMVMSEMYKMGLVLIILLLISPFLYYVFVKKITSPANKIVNTLEALKKGELPQSQLPPTYDEFNQISNSLTELIENTKKTAKFAQSIGKGDLSIFYNTLGKNDILGSSLVDMRNGLIKSQEKDSERNWIVSGNAEVSQILRIHNKIQILAHEVIRYLTEKIDAIQGAIYITDQSQNQLILKLQAVYAYGKIHKENTKYKDNEGLVGQVATEKRIIILDKIPDNYLRRTSGILGDSNPNHILALPMIYEDNVYGVLEFAGYNLGKRKINIFLQEVAIIIARTINSILQIEKTNQLLADVQKKSDELLKQQKELQSSNFEKEKAQIQLQKINAQLEDQIDEVNKSQQRMRLLLENASEVIIVYEQKGIARYVSPSVKDILGYSQSDFIGKKNKNHLHKKSLHIYEDMFDELINNPFKQVTIQVQYLNKNGEYIWVEATGANKLKDPAIEGIIVNLRNITERRKAEEEQRIRSKMQALSENSTDLILRVESNEDISYINPIIEKLTDLNPSDILNKKLVSTPLKKPITEKIIHINEKVRQSNTIVYDEFPFETIDGERNMIYSGIPEYDDSHSIESVLIVFHDITEQKNIEREVRKQNKKINDSINYASRIQGAIIHEVTELQKYVDAFMFYKARDVVTGDFPWFKKIGDNLYIAACDCTGHGVPGALMSLIGFFHLNDVVTTENDSDVAYILDSLNEQMTKTLKQDDENVKTKDGMDLALCRINLRKRTVEFAGAHRPIFIIKNRELEEIKGSRHSIGGGNKKKIQQFKHIKLKLGKGDSFYIFSDGLTDQFGGNEKKKKKFGVARVREILDENKDSGLNNIKNSIVSSWQDWRGESKQTDDVLLIGIGL